MAFFLSPEMLETFYAEANQEVNGMQWISQRWKIVAFIFLMF